MDEISLSNNSLFKEIIKRYEEKHKVKIQSKNQIRFFKVNEILHFIANKEKTIIILSNEKSIEIDKPIDEIEQQLKELPFLRIHADHIVNVNFISKVFNKNKNNIELSDGTLLPVSDIRKEFIMDFLNNYI